MKSGTESSVAYLVEHQTYNPRAWFYSHQRFGQWPNFLANLSARLLSRNLVENSDVNSSFHECV